MKIQHGILALILLVGAAGALGFAYKSLQRKVSIPQTVVTKNSTASSYTLADISTHNTEKNCWTVINNNIYDITNFIPLHPGGKRIIQACGQDSTTLFESTSAHSGSQTLAYLSQYLVGVLVR